MKALTLRQPWASLIVTGAKDVENRTWPVPSTVTRVCLGSHDRPQRGDDFPADDPEPCMCGPAPFPLVIHAAKTDTDNDPTISSMAWHALGEVIGGAAPPRGVLLGYVTVTGCHHADECADFDYVTLGGCVDIDGGWWHKPTEDRPCHTARYCSRWAEPNTYHWTLTNPVALDEPIPMRGRQGLWNLPDDALAEVKG